MAVAVEAYQHREAGMRIPIGGGGGEKIFAHVAGEIQPGTDLAIVTVNSREELSAFSYNERMFRRVGFNGEIRHLHSHMRSENAQGLLQDNIGGIYLGGGDQRRGLHVMQQLGIDTLIVDLNRDKGIVVAGTSAGASEIAEVSPVEETKIPGLSIIHGVVIDQHFAERVRFDRLYNLVKREGLLGIGVDADTAFMVDPEGKARVIGSGDIYIMPPGNGKWHEPMQMHPGEEINLQDWVMQTVYHENPTSLAAD